MPKTENFHWYVEQVAAGEIHGHALTATIAQGRSKYQTYAIVHSLLFGKMLVLDGDTQSAALDESIYHEALLHPACAAAGEPKRILILGGGEGAAVREALHVPSVEKVTMVDIDREVVDVCRRHMPEWSAGTYDDRRAEIIIADGKRYVEMSTERFDVIVGDLTEPLEDSPSFGLHTMAFYSEVRRHLTPGGMFALQASTAGPHNFDLHARMIATLRRVFPVVMPYSTYIPAFDSEWGFAVCCNDLPADHPFADIKSTAAHQAVERYARWCGGLRFYDGESHASLFNQPRYLRDAYAVNPPIIG